MPHAIEPTLEWKLTIARNFAAVLRRDIGTFNLLQAVNLNDKETDPNICHTHDFCDANTALEEAFSFDGFDTNDHELWNEVWDIAKKNDFWWNE